MKVGFVLLAHITGMHKICNIRPDPFSLKSVKKSLQGGINDRVIPMGDGILQRNDFGSQLVVFA